MFAVHAANSDPGLLCESNMIMSAKFIYVVLKHQAGAKNGDQLLLTKCVSDMVLGISNTPSIIIFINVCFMVEVEKKK